MQAAACLRGAGYIPAFCTVRGPPNADGVSVCHSMHQSSVHFYNHPSTTRPTNTKGRPTGQAPPRRGRRLTVAGSSKGFGQANGQPPPDRVGGTKEQEKIKQARNYQLEATQVLAELLKSKDLVKTAQENVDALTESFFMIASTYLDLAKKEGNIEVVNQLESTLKVALAEKEKTLRPEIRLLNRLLRVKSSAERTAIFQEDLSLLESEDGYFAGLLKRMLTDVERQPENPRKGELLAKLNTVKQEMRELLKSKH